MRQSKKYIIRAPEFRYRALAAAKLLSCVLLLACKPALATTGYLRINQVGYQTGKAARAWLMTAGPVGDTSFTVNNILGTEAASGIVGEKTGSWGDFSVYPIDFTVPGYGKYTIAVNGDVIAASPVFTITIPDYLYSRAIKNAANFYRNQRDGRGYIRSVFRTAPAHVHDFNASVYRSPYFDSNGRIIGKLSRTRTKVNAEGGWWNSGDYLKFVETTSYTVALMLAGIRDFPGQLSVKAGLYSDFTTEAKFGVDWLRRMWDDRTMTLHYQVGIGSEFESNGNILSDHDIWRLPQDDDTYGGHDFRTRYIRNRPVFRVGPAGSKISPNLAGRLAADFAMCFTVFKETRPVYANQCLLYAEHIFDLADTSPVGKLLTTAPYDFYPETQWRDDLELGATELYLALRSGNLPKGLPHTDPDYYLNQAANWAYAYITGPNDQKDSLNLFDVSGLAHFDLYRAIELAGNPVLAVTKDQPVTAIASQINASVSKSGDPFGSPVSWSNGDAIAHLAGLSVMASEYDYLTNTNTYALESRRWAANLLGANPWGVSFITGLGTNFPNCVHHQVANLLGSLTGEFPILSGAVVKGPAITSGSGSVDGMKTCFAEGKDPYYLFDLGDVFYKDDVRSYSTNELSIDLTASSILMFAWQIAGKPETIK